MGAVCGAVEGITICEGVDGVMKEFVEKLIGRLEERKEEREKQYKRASMEDGSYMLSKCFSEGARAYGNAIEITNQLAEECNVWHNCGEDCTEYKRTNADKIRAMTDEELADYIFGVSESLVPCVKCSEDCDFCELSDEECKTRTLEWLQSEAE